MSSAIPRVFISYSHDSPEHMDWVLQLSNRLREEGVDCRVDQYVDSPSMGWPRWCLKEVEESEFVLVVCTETYERRFKGEEEPGRGKGVAFEGFVITQALYDEYSKNEKFVPVVLSDTDSQYIPITLRGYTFYNLSKPEGYDQLYRRLTNQPAVTKPPVGEIKIRPRREPVATPSLPTLERKQQFPSETPLSKEADAQWESAGQRERKIVRRVREIERLMARQQLTDAIDLAQASLATLGSDPRLTGILLKTEKELELQKRKLQASPRVLDAAIPSRIIKGVGTELSVLIRLLDSPGLKGIIQADEESQARPEDVRENPFDMTFSAGSKGELEPLKVAVQVTSPDFSPPSQIKNVFVPPDRDSDVVRFVLTPARIGKLLLVVELYWEDAVRGQRRLVTECTTEAAAGEVPHNLVQMPVAVGVGNGGNSPSLLPAILDPQMLGAPALRTGPPSPSSAKAKPPSAVLAAEVKAPYDREPRRPVQAVGQPRPEEPQGKPPGDLTFDDTATLALPIPEPASSSRDAASAKASPPASSPMRFTPSTPVVVAIIGAISAILVGYWQFVYKPSHEPKPGPKAVQLGIFVMDNPTNRPVANAHVTLVRPTRREDRPTDSLGTARFLISADDGKSLRVEVTAVGYSDGSREIDAPTADASYYVFLAPLTSPEKRGGTGHTVGGVTKPPVLAGTWEVAVTGDVTNARLSKGTFDFVPQHDGSILCTANFDADGTKVTATGRASMQAYEVFLDFNATTSVGGSWDGKAEFTLSADHRHLRGRVQSKRGDDIPVTLNKL